MKFRRKIYPSERIIWIVAFASIAQTVLQSIDAQLQGSWPRFWLWLVGSAWIFGLAAWAETVKRRGTER